MKTTSLCAIAVAALAIGSAVPAQATIISFEATNNTIRDVDSSYTYTLDISDDINVATDTIISAILEIRLYDNDNQSEKVSILLDGNAFDYHGDVNGYRTYTYDSAVIATYLQGDGKLTVTVDPKSGKDVWFKGSSLTGKANRPDSVPEPASLLLLGAGLGGMGYFMRRRRKA